MLPRTAVKRKMYFVGCANFLEKYANSKTCLTDDNKKDCRCVMLLWSVNQPERLRYFRGDTHQDDTYQVGTHRRYCRQCIPHYSYVVRTLLTAYLNGKHLIDDIFNCFSSLKADFSCMRREIAGCSVLKTFLRISLHLNDRNQRYQEQCPGKAACRHRTRFYNTNQQLYQFHYTSVHILFTQMEELAKLSAETLYIKFLIHAVGFSGF